MFLLQCIYFEMLRFSIGVWEVCSIPCKYSHIDIPPPPLHSTVPQLWLCKFPVQLHWREGKGDMRYLRGSEYVFCDRSFRNFHLRRCQTAIYIWIVRYWRQKKQKNWLLNNLIIFIWRKIYHTISGEYFSCEQIISDGLKLSHSIPP